MGGGALKAPGLDAYHTRHLAARKGIYQNLSLLDVGCALNYLAGGVWTLVRLTEAGYDLAGLSQLCPLCGQHSDTAFDRLFTCSQTASLRKSIFSPADLLALKDPDFAVEAAGWALRPPAPPTEAPLNQCIPLEIPVAS